MRADAGAGNVTPCRARCTRKQTYLWWLKNSTRYFNSGSV